MWTVRRRCVRPLQTLFQVVHQSVEIKAQCGAAPDDHIVDIVTRLGMCGAHSTAQATADAITLHRIADFLGDSITDAGGSTPIDRLKNEPVSRATPAFRGGKKLDTFLQGRQGGGLQCLDHECYLAPAPAVILLRR